MAAKVERIDNEPRLGEMIDNGVVSAGVLAYPVNQSNGRARSYRWVNLCRPTPAEQLQAVGAREGERL